VNDSTKTTQNKKNPTHYYFHYAKHMRIVVCNVNTHFIL